MAKLIIPNKIKEAFISEFPKTVTNYAKDSALYCDILLKIIDTNIHCIDLDSFFNMRILNFLPKLDVKTITYTSDESIISINKIQEFWFQYYVPRIFVFLHTVTFSDMRLDKNTIYLFFENLSKEKLASPSMIKDLISEGEKQLSFFSKKCKNQDWFYSIDNILDEIDNNIVRETKINTLSLFYALMNDIEPKFLDEIKSNYGNRMNMSLILT